MTKANKKRLRERQCGNKVRHLTFQKAQEVANLLNGLEQARQGFLYVQKLQAYHCIFCEQYHVGHTPRKMLLQRGVKL